MKQNLLILLLLTSLIKAEVKPEVEFILTGNITFGVGAKNISPQKVDAALNLAGLLTNKYYFISIMVRDSIANKLRKLDIIPTLDKIADTLKVEKIAFINVNKIHNIIRVEMVLANKNNPELKTQGIGYDLIRYHDEKNTALIDPALLRATQRAFANAIKNINLYNVDSLKEFKILPAPTVVITGIEYNDNPSIMPKWNIFYKSVITSYLALETIFSEARHFDNYVFYDIETRDSIYALHNLFIPENYRPVSYSELQALNHFQIDYVITGKLIRTQNGCDIEISLNKIKNNNLEPIKIAKDILINDDIEEFKAVLRNLTYKLLREDRK